MLAATAPSGRPRSGTMSPWHYAGGWIGPITAHSGYAFAVSPVDPVQKGLVPAMEILFLLALILLNGLFAMSEMAVVSSRKIRLQQMAQAGGAGARAAFDLAAFGAAFCFALPRPSARRASASFS